jgi:hypothetical protein
VEELQRAAHGAGAEALLRGQVAVRHLRCVQRAQRDAGVRRDGVRVVDDQHVRARRHAPATGAPAEGMLRAESYSCGPGVHGSTRRLRP